MQTLRPEQPFHTLRTIALVCVAATLLVACGGGGGGRDLGPGFPSVSNVSPAPLDDLPDGVTMEAYGFAQGLRYDATTGSNTDFRANFNLPRVRRATTRGGDDTYQFYFSKADIDVTITLPESGVARARTNRDTLIQFRPVPGAYTYTAAGVWSFDRSAREFDNILGPYAFGVPTTVTGLQGLGSVTVTYGGSMTGEYRNRSRSSGVSGEVDMTATFTPTGDVSTVITGSVTNVSLLDIGGGRALNDFQFTGTGEGATFEGTITAQSGAGFDGTDFADGTDGPVVGLFTGPNAEEAGMSFRVFDSDDDKALVGAMVVVAE